LLPHNAEKLPYFCYACSPNRWQALKTVSVLHRVDFDYIGLIIRAIRAIIPGWLPIVQYRFGPPTAAEAAALFDHIRTGSILFADSARAYIRLRCVSTQGIDGAWGRLKVWFAAKGGVASDHIAGYVKEFQWRSNMSSSDLFVKLCEHIRDGYFQ